MYRTEFLPTNKMNYKLAFMELQYLRKFNIYRTLVSVTTKFDKVRETCFDSQNLTLWSPEDLRLLQLSGTIPTEIGLLSRLTLFHILGENLLGTIPSEIGRLTMLGKPTFSSFFLFNT
jgi:hypothetical protein